MEKGRREEGIIQGRGEVKGDDNKQPSSGIMERIYR